jgi:hypothetical protein
LAVDRLIGGKAQREEVLNTIAAKRVRRKRRTITVAAALELPLGKEVKIW